MGRPAPFILSPDTLDYWLDLWIRTYRALLDEAQQGRCLFVCHEELCTDARLWPKLAEQLNVRTVGAPAFHLKEEAEPDYFDGAIMRRARAVYDELKHRTAEWVTAS